jgi:hypothetical protein
MLAMRLVDLRESSFFVFGLSTVSASQIFLLRTCISVKSG